MSSDLSRFISQNEKWMDTLKRDTVFSGIGTANNQLHRKDGRKSEMHPPEDRSFAVVLKDESVYAYGILDGFNGTSAVEFIEPILLLNLFIEEINDNIENKSDSEIFGIIQEQIQSCEQLLENSLNNKMSERTSLSIRIADIPTSQPQYYELLDKLKAYDTELSSGTFLALSLIVGKRMFTANVGTVRCFLYTTNTDGCNSVLPLSLEHTLSNQDEEFRIQKLKGITNCAILNSDENFINHTRSLGDFKTKVYYNELEQFRKCTKAPIISDPEHFSPATCINDDCLFMVMYSEALGKAIEKTGLDSSNVEEKIAQMLLEKIKTEASLNSAAQSVVDEIKRAYDDSCKPGLLALREDLTLIVRVFNENLKDELNKCETTCSYPTYIDSLGSSMINTDNSDATASNKSNEMFDEHGHVIPYVDFSDYNTILNSEVQIRTVFENFERELENLATVDDNSRL